MAFQYAIHNQILQILGAVNCDFFESCSILFGGGTMLALEYGEYRLSRDIDFLCPYGEPFSRLRRRTFEQGYAALFNLDKCTQFEFPQEMRTDRDGVRFAIAIDQTILKFEIVAEGRIVLASPAKPAWSPVVCLSTIDRIVEKLLANGDRWPDQSVLSRDLIDLAILRHNMAFPQAAFDKAEAAYPTIEPLKRSILSFQAKPDYRLRCYERLQLESPAVAVDGLDALASQLGLPLFDRQSIETKKPTL